MIKIIKTNAPEKLIISGAKETKKDLEKLKLNKDKYYSGELKFEAKNSIYNSDIVRETLENIQHNKCCYCETKNTRSNIDVEHFRPKQAYSIDFKGKSNYPGYFWLAYEWDNLFLACQVCNQIFKNDFFPIEDESNRAQLNDFSIENEVTFFVHPSIDNPENEIEYIEDIPIGKTEKGKKTIAYLGFGTLEHGENFNIEYSEKHKTRIFRLMEEREEYYKTIKIINDVIKAIEILPPTTERIELLNQSKKKIKNAQKADSEWSLMIKCAVQKDFNFD